MSLSKEVQSQAVWHHYIFTMLLLPSPINLPIVVLVPILTSSISLTLLVEFFQSFPSHLIHEELFIYQNQSTHLISISYSQDFDRIVHLSLLLVSDSLFTLCVYITSPYQDCHISLLNLVFISASILLLVTIELSNKIKYNYSKAII